MGATPGRLDGGARKRVRDGVVLTSNARGNQGTVEPDLESLDLTGQPSQLDRPPRSVVRVRNRCGLINSDRNQLPLNV